MNNSKILYIEKSKNNPTPTLPIKGRGHFAFTLAEVLITLGVIGVVAGMTMPTLIAHHKKKVVVTRMQKFYSSMNQALKLSETQNGEYRYWDEIQLGQFNPDTMYDWYKRYLADYFKSKDIEKTADGILVANTDGSAFGLYNSNSSVTAVHAVFCTEYKICKKRLNANNNKIVNSYDGKNEFLFFIKHPNGPLVAYGIQDNITREQAKNGVEGHIYGCAKSYKAYCSALIQMDGWQIADDYPVKF